LRKLVAFGAVVGLSGLVVVLALLAGNQTRSLLTLRKVDDYPLYVMHRYGDYGFDEYLQGGMRTDVGQRTDAGPPANQPEPSAQWACTCFATMDSEGHAILGRNFDWFNRPTLLLFSHPPGGYASVSMVDISYLGFDALEPTWEERVRLLEAPYLPFDGLNEAGLAVGMMAVPNANAGTDPHKVTIDSLAAIRLLLDHAGSADEAISLLGGYNINWGGGPPLHYLVADLSGDSAVIEFVGGVMKVLRSEEPWQVSTNFVISGEDPGQARSLCWRYARASERLEWAAGRISRQEAMELLEDVSQDLTMWSVVYDMTDGDVSVAMGRDYDQIHEFALSMQNR
jgi:hypothetical protein